MKEASIGTPDKAALDRLQLLRPAAITSTGTASAAAKWYIWAKAYPSTTTKGRFLQKRGLHLNGPHPYIHNLILAYDKNGRTLVVKIINAAAEGSEAVVDTLLHDGPSLVKCELITVKPESLTANKRVFQGLLM